MRAGFMPLPCSKLYENVHSGALLNSQRIELLKKPIHIFKKNKLSYVGSATDRINKESKNITA